MSNTNPVEELVAAYISKRDQLNDLKKKHKEVEAAERAALDKVETVFLKYLEDNQTESIKTKAGTVFRKTTVSATVKDWEATLDFIKANEDWGMLDRRVNKTAVQEHMDQTGEGVPGVEVSSYTTVNIRRS